MHGDDIARLGKIGGMLNGAERRRRRAGVGVIAAGRNVEIGGSRSRGQREDGEPNG